MKFLSLFEEVGERGNDAAETIDEAAVETSKA